MTVAIPVNEYTVGLLIVAALVAYGTLVHNWPKIRDKVTALMPRLSRELDRESADLDNFVKKAHENIDAEIADLQAKKKRVADAAAAVKKVVGS